MRKAQPFAMLILPAVFVVSTATLSPAQQTTTQPGTDHGTPAHAKAMTIDCPASALQQQTTGSASQQPTGGTTAANPQSGSGLSAMPAMAPPQKIEGQITSIGSTRTNRIVEIGDLKLEVEPNSVVLVGCKPATVADLKPGANVKAAYQVKEPNRNMALVIEAQQ